jgi:hypothetical protein
VAVAVLGAGALGATVAALFVSQSSPSYRVEEIGPLASETRTAVAAASADAIHQLEGEVTAAASLPQLKAALGDKVDTSTMEDLLETERWWEPYRARAAAVIGPHGPLATRNSPTAGLGAAELKARTAPGRPAGQLVSLGERPFVEAAAVIEVEDLPQWLLVLARPLDRALLAEWSERAHASLLLSDGHRALLSDTALRPDALVGHEAETLILNAAAGTAATPLALAPGLWLWCVRPLPPELAEGRPVVPLAALAGALALAAIAVRISRRRGQIAAADGIAMEFAVRSQIWSPGSGPVSAPVTAPRSTPVRSTPFPRESGAASPTMIVSGDPHAFGRYTVISRLGEGGMCELFTAGLAGPEGFQRVLVLKRLKPEIARNRAAVDQFIDEAKLGSTLVHANIVPVFDFGHVGDGYFMAQEYVVGRDVGQIIERHMERLREPLDLASVLYITYEALQALAYAHERTNEAGEPLHIVHRDVSPGNILVGAGGEVKLIDFGIAKSEGRVSRTDIGNVKGNAAFMAPEQARGLTIDRRADLFSLGLVAYYALTGEPLYEGGTSAEMFYAAVSGPSPQRLQRLNSLPPLVVQILSRALAADPAERYATAEEFAADIVDHIAPGARASMATLLNALFGPELRPASGGGGSGSGTPGFGTSNLRRRTG